MSMSPDREDRWWNAAPARNALEKIDSSMHAGDLLEDRLGEDCDRWLVAVALMASDFPGTMAELADTAEEAARTGQCPPPPEWTAIGEALERMISFAPRLAVDPIVCWMGPDGRRLLAEQTTWYSEQACALIRHGDLAIRRELAKDRERMDQGGPYPPAPDQMIITALLELDDPETNLFLLHDDRLTHPDTFDVLTGRPFGAGRTEPVPRLPETLAMAGRIAELVSPRERARRFDASEPEHIMLALHAVNDDGTAVLDFYEQCVSGLLLARAGRTDLLAEALTLVPLLPWARESYTRSLADPEGSVESLERDVVLTQHIDGFYEVALDRRTRRNFYGGSVRRDRPSRLLAHSHARAEDPWYPLDWDVARTRAADPAKWNPRGLPAYDLRALVQSADCPPDLVRRLTHEETADEYSFLHLFQNRSEGLDLLRSLRLTTDSGPIALWAATPDGEDWRPEITIADVVQLAHPAHALTDWWTGRALWPFPTYVEEAATTALEALLADLSPEQRTALTERLPTFEGTLPELLDALPPATPAPQMAGRDRP
ncbi:hypothetical protein ABZZ17_24095 [Streptomyces sp. NPDC006512]|uniref:hypothetical protein n=1 Tax=Streptomyces sp. NPDC006512 TaxID=3154307 RepID=UPI0033AED3ED